MLSCAWGFRCRTAERSIIGWIKPGTPRLHPFAIKTRLATASIQGTTVFLEFTDRQFKVFSWEGTVEVETSHGRRFTLKSGQQLLLDLKRQLVEVSGRLDGLEAALGERSGIVTAGSRVETVLAVPGLVSRMRRSSTGSLLNGFHPRMLNVVCRRVF